MKTRSSFALFFAILSVQAQQIWNLEDCIDHALKNNISLKQSELNIELNENQYKLSTYIRKEFKIQVFKKKGVVLR